MDSNRSATLVAATLVAAMLLVSACSDSGGPSPVPAADIAFVQGVDIYTTSLDSVAVPHPIARGFGGAQLSPDGKLVAARRVASSKAWRSAP